MFFTLPSHYRIDTSPGPRKKKRDGQQDAELRWLLDLSAPTQEVRRGSAHLRRLLSPGNRLPLQRHEARLDGQRGEAEETSGRDQSRREAEGGQAAGAEEPAQHR